MKCPTCGNEYQRLSSHLGANNSCEYPEFSERQKEIITGLIMGDGCISDDNGRIKPRLILDMANEEFLYWVKGELQNHVTGVSKKNVDFQRQADKGQFDTDPDNYSDIYTLQTMTTPELYPWLDWYSSGEKVFPESIVLTPLTLKVWYCCDGTYSTSGYDNSIKIGASNEYHNTKKLKNLFNEIMIEPTFYKYQQHGRKSLDIKISNEESQYVFDYMGDHLPGFKYKWP